MQTATAAIASRIRSPGLASALVSGAALWWRARRELGRPLAPFNAPSHWLWGDRALRQERASLRYTAVGTLTHVASSLLWAVLFDRLRSRHARPTVKDAVADAVVTAGVAAGVDLLVVPQRLTPGFERQLSARSLVWFYAAFASGLAIGGLLASTSRRT